MEPAQSFLAPYNATAELAYTHHLLAGSFRSFSLFLLAFSPLHRTLSLVQTVDAFGPHQYLATNPRKDRVYATSWALPPCLSSWEIDRPLSAPWRVSHINTVPITATSSYITLPPPYTHLYSAGGPTGEVHQVDKNTGGFGKKLQQILFVPEDELEKADKTRVALRYGSHGVEFSSVMGHAFIPVLGTNTIEMYAHNSSIGTLKHIASVPSPRGPHAHDGPRHVKVHPNGKLLYCVTEHANIVDAYSITPDSLSHVASRSLLPPDIATPTSFRGDTLLLAPATEEHPAPRALFTTTRGSTTADRGFLSVFSLDADGMFTNKEERYETPTSGGKANAIDLLSKSASGPALGDTPSEAVWILLTDDDDSAAALEGGNAVRVLEWDGWDTGGVKSVTGWPAPGEQPLRGKERIAGGSHAIWLD